MDTRKNTGERGSKYRIGCGDPAGRRHRCQGDGRRGFCGDRRCAGRNGCYGESSAPGPRVIRQARRMKVPFSDLGELHRPLHDELVDAFTGVMSESTYILGPPVNRFEVEFASYLERAYCVAVSSGTAALHLALLAAGVHPGDEVLTTPLTWISTSWAISYCGARPVFVDVEASTGNLDPGLVERSIGPRTRAILPVDLYGNPSRLDQLEALADDQDVRLIDDACQAHGARFHLRRVGAFGDLACFSFYPGKNLGGVGEGGAVVTDDGELAERMRQLRDHAQSERHNHVAIGFNYRMDGLQGAALSVKLRHLDRWNQEHAQVRGTISVRPGQRIRRSLAKCNARGGDELALVCDSRGKP